MPISGMDVKPNQPARIKEDCNMHMASALHAIFRQPQGKAALFTLVWRIVTFKAQFPKPRKCMDNLPDKYFH
jgi:hypothetical protein